MRLLGKGEQPQWQGRGHFFAAAAEAMRRILVEAGRRKRSRKHGGQHTREDIDLVEPAAPELGDDILALDEALTRFAAKDRVKADLVKDALLRRADAGSSGGGAWHLPRDGGSLLGIRPCLALRRDHPR